MIEETSEFKYITCVGSSKSKYVLRLNPTKFKYITCVGSSKKNSSLKKLTSHKIGYSRLFFQLK